MKSLPAGLRLWGQDVLFRRVMRNSAYLFGSNVIGAVLSILTANLLGVASFGVLGIITSLVTNIKRLLSFRMSEVVVKHMSEYLAAGDRPRAAAIVKAGMLTEGVTSLLAFAVLALAAPLAARYLVNDPGATPLFLIYGLEIIGCLVTETSIGVLQVGNHFRSQALINLVQSLFVAVLIVLASFQQAGLWQVVFIYLVGKLILGISPILVAFYWLPRMLGAGWWRAPLSLLPQPRRLAGFAISTNFSGTINVVARDSEQLWISLFFSPVEAGYFKVAMALINLIVMPITPFISTTFPEITRALARKAWPRLHSLLRRVTLVAAAWTVAVSIGLLLLGRPLLFEGWSLFGRTFNLYSPEYLPAFPVLLILLGGYGVANVFFWNRTLLLAMGQAAYPLKIAALTSLAKVALTLLLVPRYGYLMEALLLSVYFIVWVGLTVRHGLRDLRRLELQESGGAS